MKGEGELATCYEGIVLGDEDLIIIEIDTQIPEEVSEVIKILSVKFLEKDYVIDKFCESVISREKSFPTELSTIIPVTFPHTDATYYKKSTIVVLLLQGY